MDENISVIDELIEALRIRYRDTSIIPNAIDNEILANLNNKNYNISNDKEIFNPNISYLFGGHKNINERIPLHISNEITNNILNELDLIPTKEDLLRIKEKKINLMSIGYGGASINFFHNINIIGKELSILNLFNKVNIFENDNLDITNVFRIAKPLYNIHNKLIYEDNYKHNMVLPEMFKGSLLRNESNITYNNINFFKQYLTDNSDILNKMKEKNYIIFGAPNIETRKLLREYNLPFFFTGHGDYEVDIVHQPEIFEGITSETYGNIDIPALLINLYLMTCKFIKILANEDIFNVNQNEKLFSFDIKNYLEDKGI